MNRQKRQRFLMALLLIFSQFIYSAVFAASCKNYSTCRQAVINWCEGNHPRADGDNDGIPCENVCRSKKQVDKIRKEIGC